jgi:4-aminobutyrate aminotransferase-like enzyme
VDGGKRSDPFYDVDDSSDSSGRAAGLATLEVMESEKLIENAASKGERLSAFRNMAERHELLKTVRGKGLMTDRIRRSQLAAAESIVEFARNREQRIVLSAHCNSAAEGAPYLT